MKTFFENIAVALVIITLLLIPPYLVGFILYGINITLFDYLAITTIWVIIIGIYLTWCNFLHLKR